MFWRFPNKETDDPPPLTQAEMIEEEETRHIQNTAKKETQIICCIIDLSVRLRACCFKDWRGS